MDEERNRGRRLPRGFDRNQSTLRTFIRRQRWDVENVICRSSTVIASILQPSSPEREREGEINLIRIRKQTKHASKISHMGGKSERNMWQDSERVRSARVSALIFVTGSPWADVGPAC